jgi:hypothetical protein
MANLTMLTPHEMELFLLLLTGRSNPRSQRKSSSVRNLLRFTWITYAQVGRRGAPDGRNWDPAARRRHKNWGNPRKMAEVRR